MTGEEEIAHLKKRRAELQTIECNLTDMHDWFESQLCAMQSEFDTSGLARALAEVSDSICCLDDWIDHVREIVASNERAIESDEDFARLAALASAVFRGNGKVQP